MVTNQKYKMYIQVEKLLQYSTVQRGKPEQEDDFNTQFLL